jgi:multicomponent Na+:H+ antiporter subunit F
MIETTTHIALAMLSLSLLMALVRLVRGPNLEDRALALDFVSTVCIAVAAVVAIRWQDTVYLDVAVVLALTAFIATIAFARYLERAGER